VKLGPPDKQPGCRPAASKVIDRQGHRAFKTCAFEVKEKKLQKERETIPVFLRKFSVPIHPFFSVKASLSISDNVNQAFERRRPDLTRNRWHSTSTRYSS
jgi:hypothetical protein